MPATDLQGKHVVVTGGTGALGRAVVELFLEAGAVCHVPHRGAAAPGAAAERLHFTGGVELSDEAAVARYYGGLPPLWASVHAAGGYAGGPFVATSLADLRAQLDQNLTSAFLCCREAVKRMDGAGGGRIVNVAARSAVEPRGGAIAYDVSKAGVVALTRGLAHELRETAVLVNAVLPSTIDTPANRKAMPGPPESYARWAPPADIAAAILWLASADNRLTSGAAIPVYGRP